MTRRAVVVGAGIAGLASAIGLVRDGWRVEVLERSDRVQVLGTALGIWADAQQVLHRLGLGDLVRAGARPTQVMVRSSEGRILVAVGGEAADVVLVSRSELVAALLAALPPGVVRTGVEVSTPADLPADADLVVAADGVRSSLRAAMLGEPAQPRYSGYLAFRGIVQGDFAPAGEIWGRGCLFGLTVLRPGTTNWYCAVRTDEVSALQLTDLQRLLALWPEPVGPVLQAAGDTYLRHPIIDLDRPLRRTSAGRTVVVGDAAHAMTPHLGQGANQALIDADTLTQVLAAQPDVQRALTAYDRRRRRTGQRLVGRSRMMGRVSHATTFAPLRDALLGGVGTFVPTTRAARRRIAS